MKKKLIAIAVAAGAALASVPASATVVAGIDFGNDAFHLETTTLAQQFLNPGTTAAGTGSGMGYGVVSTVNGAGASTYCTLSSTCSLFYTMSYTGGTFTSANTVQFTGTTVNLYLLNTTTNLLSQDSVANLAMIQSGTLYASLIGHGNLGGGLDASVVSASVGSLTGLSLNYTGQGLLDVDLSAAGNAAFEAFLDGNLVADAAGGLADLIYTESATNFSLNPKDVVAGLAAGCKTGTAATGAWCLQGSLSTQGTGEIPEPGTLALFALGLLGAGVMRRRQS